jgi:hypothetical protein
VIIICWLRIIRRMWWSCIVLRMTSLEGYVILLFTSMSFMWVDWLRVVILGLSFCFMIYIEMRWKGWIYRICQQWGYIREGVRRSLCFIRIRLMWMN